MNFVRRRRVLGRRVKGRVTSRLTSTLIGPWVGPVLRREAFCTPAPAPHCSVEARLLRRAGAPG